MTWVYKGLLDRQMPVTRVNFYNSHGSYNTNQQEGTRLHGAQVGLFCVQEAADSEERDAQPEPGLGVARLLTQRRLIAGDRLVMTAPADMVSEVKKVAIAGVLAWHKTL